MTNLPTTMLNTFYDLFRVEAKSLDAQLHGAIQAIDRKAAAAGMLLSGNTIILVCEAGATSLSVRCRMAWSLLFKSMAAYDIEVNGETVSLFLSQLGSQSANAAISVKSIVRTSAVFRRLKPDGAALKAGIAIIDQALDHEVAKMKAEAALLVAATSRAKVATPQPTITITGDGNVFVMGDSNQVNASLQIDTQTSAALLEALKLTLEALSTVRAVDGRNVQEIEELVADTIKTIDAPRPNGLKIKASIKAIAETIKFIPALRPAYDTIKSAAALIGIYLP